jgi:hypothetical protein
MNDPSFAKPHLTSSDDVDHIAGVMGGSDAGSANDQRAKAAFARLQTLAAQQAANAQVEAARAAKETAEYTRAGARYMRWSVIVLALSSVATALFSAWDHWFRYPCP